MRKQYFIPLIILFQSLTIFVHICYALSIETHEQMNKFITENKLNGFSFDEYLYNHLDFTKGKDQLITKDTTTQKVYEWVMNGGFYEDDPPEYSIPYRRSRNHFHNPLLPWSQAYYTDWYAFCVASDNPPFSISGHCPTSAILWALGPQLSDTYGIDLNPGGDWSWWQTRWNFYYALTSASTSSRDADFADTFRGLGQLMHLVQDMSVPEHSRNDFHAAYGYEEWVADPNNVNISAYKPDPAKNHYFGGTINIVGRGRSFTRCVAGSDEGYAG